jgi:hypothetical protein
MTDEQIKKLEAGQRIVVRRNGRDMEYLVYEVRSIGTCLLESSGAFGHASALIDGLAGYQEDRMNENGGTPSGVTRFAISSDESIKGRGQETHDEHGVRIRGTELL